MHHYQDLGTSAFDWPYHQGNLIQPIRNNTQIWVVTCHQYGISALISQTSFRRETVVASRNVSCFLRLKELSNESIELPKMIIIIIIIIIGLGA